MDCLGKDDREEGNQICYLAHKIHSKFIIIYDRVGHN